MDEKIATLKKWVDESDNIVFFGGAGVSTESGIPDFRSVDGLYNQKYDYPPETIFVKQANVPTVQIINSAQRIRSTPGTSTRWNRICA